MLTPKFTVRQDDGFVIVEMKIPGHVKLGEDDVWMEGCSFKFHAHPYFLSLELPGEVVQDGREHAEFDRANDRLTVWIPKMNYKEHFDGLDMLTRLMTPVGSVAGPASTTPTTTGIEVVGGGSKKRRNEDDINEALNGDGHEEEEQQGMYSDELMLGISRPTYGFNNGFSNFFEPLQEDLHEIVDIPDPDHVLAQDRRFLREQDEDQKFNPDHYMADLMEFDDAEMLGFKPWWTTLREEFESSLKTLQESGDEAMEKNGDDEDDDDDDDDMGSWNPASIAMLSTPKIKSDMEQLRIKIIPLNEDDQEILLKLPRREFLTVNEANTLSTLVDILLAYAYDVRTTLGESTVESPWTVCKLSTSFSWLDQPISLNDAVRNFAHRMLAFPLYRSWKLVEAAVRDVSDILRLGRRGILKALLEVRGVLGRHENRHYLNTLFVDHFCVWIQGVLESRIAELRDNLGRIVLDKYSLIRWPLRDFDDMASDGFNPDN